MLLPIALLAVLVVAVPATAADQASASYVVRAAHWNAGAATALSSTAPSPRYSGSGVSLGQTTAMGFASSSTTLRSSVPGFWAIVAGAFPTLDVDGDLLAAFHDPDDDNDGLLDAVETRTGVFVSASDTGSDPQVVDSDGDGVPDGIEVAVSRDPNDPTSLPKLPALAWFGQLALILAVVGAGTIRLLRRKR